MMGFEIYRIADGRAVIRRTCAGKLALKSYLGFRWVR